MVGILNAALSQHHFLGFEIVQLGFHHLHQLCSNASWGPLDFTLQDVCDHTTVVMPVVKALCVQFSCVSLPRLLNLFCFCSLLTVSVFYHATPSMKQSSDISSTLEIFPLYCFPLLLSIVHTNRSIAPCYSLELCIPLIESCLLSLACRFSSFPSIGKAFPDNDFAPLPFFLQAPFWSLSPV